MRSSAVAVYRCPYSGQTLHLDESEASGGAIVSGCLVSEAGLTYPIVDGIPHLIQPERETYSLAEVREKEYYESTALDYDAVIEWLFESFYEDEARVRGGIIDLLELDAQARVLETGAGTCRDTELMAHRLGPGAKLFVQDLSPNMLAVGRDRLGKAGVLDGELEIELSVGNAMRLPFPDDYFDAAYHFGGLNLFTDKRAALAEMTRVVHPGGRVVVGDEGLAPWHRASEYGAILMNSNRLYAHEAPVDCIPETVRDASVRWILGNAFYVMDFTVADEPPRVNLDLPIQGSRGGTHRTRYFGQLEGVTVETRALALEAAARAGLSVHEWLDRAVRAALSSQAPDETSSLTASADE
jgi:ubiquinone/menaquinone biosynthesis C-methylase UbiE/uncharacterized protein YbaR (Trm112 family)